MVSSWEENEWTCGFGLENYARKKFKHLIDSVGCWIHCASLVKGNILSEFGMSSMENNWARKLGIGLGMDV